MTLVPLVKNLAVVGVTLVPLVKNEPVVGATLVPLVKNEPVVGVRLVPLVKNEPVVGVTLVPLVKNEPGVEVTLVTTCCDVDVPLTTGTFSSVMVGVGVLVLTNSTEPLPFVVLPPLGKANFVVLLGDTLGSNAGTKTLVGPLVGGDASDCARGRTGNYGSGDRTESRIC